MHHIRPEVIPRKPDVLLRAYGNLKYSKFTENLNKEGNLCLKVKILKEILDNFIDKQEVKRSFSF
jgi:hypothetical protein